MGYSSYSLIGLLKLCLASCVAYVRRVPAKAQSEIEDPRLELRNANKKHKEENRFTRSLCRS